jgi:hypothetical protein|tara:strand:- start:7140 stop:7682 length:543 start_codon:yes stop_codon:yes gene_type:complete
MKIKADILPENIESIKNNKVTFVKNFATIKNIYDFNLLFSFLEKLDIPVNHKKNNFEPEKEKEFNFLEKVFQISNVHYFFPDFQFLKSFLEQVFKYPNHPRDGCELFFGLKSMAGISHEDIEDVFIIGLDGTVVYKVFTEETKHYEINKGDLIYIPKGIRHKVVGLSPRITLSVGFYNEK